MRTHTCVCWCICLCVRSNKPIYEDISSSEWRSKEFMRLELSLSQYKERYNTWKDKYIRPVTLHARNVSGVDQARVRLCKFSFRSRSHPLTLCLALYCSPSLFYLSLLPFLSSPLSPLLSPLSLLSLSPLFSPLSHFSDLSFIVFLFPLIFRFCSPLFLSVSVCPDLASFLFPCSLHLFAFPRLKLVTACCCFFKCCSCPWSVTCIAC